MPEVQRRFYRQAFVLTEEMERAKNQRLPPPRQGSQPFPLPIGEHMNKSRWFWVKVAGTLVALLLLAWLLAQQDWAALLRALRRLSPQVLVAALGLYWLGLLVNGWRWHTLLRGVGIPVPFWKAVRLTLGGSFASNFLPSTIGGDALRVTGILDVTDARTALASVVVDRLVNVAAMYSFLPLTWKTFGTLSPALGQAGGKVVASAPAFPRQIGEWLQHFIQALSAWARAPRTLLAGLAVSWLSLLPPFTATWLLARALGMPVAWYEVVGAAVISYTAALLPISLNGYGVREVTVVGLYTVLGATIGQALALAVVTRFLMMIATLSGAPWVSEAVPEKHPPESGGGR